MDAIILLLIIASVVSKINKNNKAKKQEQAKGQGAARPQPQVDPHALPADAFDWDEEDAPDGQVTMEEMAARRKVYPPAAPAPVAAAAPRGPVPEGAGMPGSLGSPSGEGVGMGGSLGAPSQEGQSQGGSLGAASTEGVGFGGSLPRSGPAPTRMHVVQPFTESNHSHGESSMTGFTPCPPQKPERFSSDEKKPAPSPALPYGLAFNRQSALQGLIYAEILGKPKALSKQRRYGR